MDLSTIKHVSIATLLALTLGCGKKAQTVDPATPTPIPEHPVVEPVQKTEIDVQLLRITPYFNRFLNGSTAYISKLNPEKWLARPVQTPYYGNMLTKGATIQLIAIGGGITAGAQNGGLYRDGQLTAYPNLVARQLGMVDFTTPAFDQQHENGTGFDVRGEGTILSLLRVANAQGTLQQEKDGNPPVFHPYSGKVHNFSAPWLTVDGSYLYWHPSLIGRSVNLNGVSWPMALPYLRRFIPESIKSGTLFDYIQNDQSYNFFILEDKSENFLNVLRFQGLRKIGFDDVVGDITSGVDRTGLVLEKLTSKGQKGVVFTVPSYQDLGIGSWPYPTLSEDEIRAFDAGVNLANKTIRQWAVYYDLALVDLNALYHQIQEGTYKTEQGLVIRGGLEGNFFSSDGIYPSILGQAIIANEVCRALNAKYQARVPLIDINEYLSAIGYSNK